MSAAARPAPAWTKNVSWPSAFFPLRTIESTSRLASRASARFMKLCSNPGAPSTTSTRRLRPAGVAAVRQEHDAGDAIAARALADRGERAGQISLVRIGGELVEIGGREALAGRVDLRLELPRQRRQELRAQKRRGARQPR